MDELPELRPGDVVGEPTSQGFRMNRLLANALNTAARMLRRLARTHFAPPFDPKDSQEGRRVAVDLPPEFWARVSGAANPYSFVEQRYEPGTGFVDGDIAGDNAYESKGKTGLGGMVVRLAYQPTSDDWRFQWYGRTTICTGLTRICATVTICASGYPAVGLTVTVTKDDVEVGSGVTDSSGQVCIEVGESGSYDVSVDGDCGTATATVAVVCEIDNAVDLNLPGVDFTLNIESECNPVACGTIAPLANFVITGPNGFEFHVGSFVEGDPIPICLPYFGTYTITWDGACDGPQCFDAVNESFSVGACTLSHLLHLTNKQYLLTVTALGCLATPSPDITVTISSVSGGGGSGTTDASGQFSALVKALCEYSVTVGGGRYQTVTSSGLVMPCNDQSLSFSPAVAAGYACFCNCKNPVLTQTSVAWCGTPGGGTYPKFRVVDSSGSHPIFARGGTLASDCIVGSLRNVRCFTIGARCCGGSYSAVVPYQYELRCQGSKVTLIRYVPACGNTIDVDCIIGDGTYSLMASSCNPDPCASPTFQSATSPGGCQVPGANAVPAVVGEAVSLDSADCGGAGMNFTFTFGWSETVSLIEDL